MAGQIGVEHDVADLTVGLEILRDDIDVALQEYLESVVRTRDGWSDLYTAIREVL